MSILAEILSSKVRSEIFRLLFGVDEKPLHMREIQRRAGYAIGTIQTELKKLLQLDLVTRRQEGNRVYYQANKQHPLYPDIRNVVLKTSGLVSLLHNALVQNLSIRVAFIFGSFARSDEKGESDVDLMVIGDLTLREVTALLSGVSEKISREINPHVLRVEEFVERKTRGEHFISQVLKSPKIFIIGSENDLGKMGR